MTQARSIPRRTPGARWAAAAAALISLGAQAQAILQPSPRTDRSDADSLLWRAGVQWQHDDNVFLQPEAQARSDNLLVTSAGLSVNKPWSLQRLELDINLDNYKYQNYSALDFTALNYNGAFRWAITPRLRGNVLADRREFTDRFSDVSGNNVNRRTEQNHGLEAEYEVGAAWRALGGVFERRVSNSAAVQEPDTTVRGGELGARYDFRTGNSLGYRFRQGQGEYSGGISTPSGFTDQQHELDLRWQPTGQVRVNGRVGWLSREHDTQAQRDFSGWIGRLNATWALTGKTSIQGGLVRELAAFQTTTTSYYEGYRLFIAPEWKPTVKTAVRLRWDHGMRTYKGSPLPTVTAGREDRLNIVALGLEWEPMRALRLLATVQRDERRSNLPGLDYTANIYGLAAVASF